ncbi:unnamed protein product, partial [Ectocarpus sp. 13 AM-2016]
MPSIPSHAQICYTQPRLPYYTTTPCPFTNAMSVSSMSRTTQTDAHTKPQDTLFTHKTIFALSAVRRPPPLLHTLHPFRFRVPPLYHHQRHHAIAPPLSPPGDINNPSPSPRFCCSLPAVAAAYVQTHHTPNELNELLQTIHTCHRRFAGYKVGTGLNNETPGQQEHHHATPRKGSEMYNVPRGRCGSTSLFSQSLLAMST